MIALVGFLGAAAVLAQVNLEHRNTYQQYYGRTKAAAALDPAKDLPRYPAVPLSGALATWKVKSGFKLELAAHEPQIADPIAVSFDENGRIFVCEMVDYSERRDENPHLGRIVMLEDKDGDGMYETSTVFADNLPWPTGLIWANGSLFVGATPDIWRFEDRNGDGQAEVREKVFTGFGTGLKRLNVQALLNSFQWGQDNRIHVEVPSGNRGVIRNLKRPELQAEELASRNFWFDPLTYEFGFVAGGGQYGMSFDNYGRRFACSNSDHLQFWVYDDRYAGQNPYFELPAPRRSIAADGGAAEVYRISLDEPWRIVRTRWRIGGVVPGTVEGGGRVSGYLTGATGTTVYRGDAYGPDFVNNTFTGDAGGQLVHRKKIYPDGVSLVGRRPDDEQDYEFAASTDTWVRVANFANAPDGCLYVMDMYREVIEHPWSIPDEIKQHLDLNNGNDRGRIYRLVPDSATWQRRSRVQLGRATLAELVMTLEHANGWHRDTASRLLYERQDKAAVPLLTKLVRETRSPLARHHALSVLEGLGGLDEGSVLVALGDADARVRERGILMAEKLLVRGHLGARMMEAVAERAGDEDARVRFQLAFTAQTALAAGSEADVRTRLQPLARAYARLAARDHADTWLAAALLSGKPEIVAGVLFPALTADLVQAKQAAPFVAKLIEIRAALQPGEGYVALVDFVAQPGADPAWLRALGDGLRRAGKTIEQADAAKKLAAVFTRAATTAADARGAVPARLEAIELLSVASLAQAQAPLAACLRAGQPEEVQVAAIQALAARAQPEVTRVLLENYRNYGSRAAASALSALLSREDRLLQLLEAVLAGSIPASALSAAQVQALAQNKNPQVAARAKVALAAVIPPSRDEVTANYRPAIDLAGDAGRGRIQYMSRCFVCHHAGDQGIELGPNLVTVKAKGRDGLLSAILDPHKEVAPQYIAYDVNTKDGNAYTGIIARDDATSLSLKIMGGAEVTIPRSNVKSSTSSGKSLMPEGLEAGMSVQDMADLLSFIEGID